MLFSMLSAAQGGKSIALLSRYFGLSHRQMTNVIRQYLPVFMRGIQHNFAKHGGLSSLLKVLDKGNYSSYYEDPNIYCNPDVRNNGLILMEQAFGSEENQRKIYNRIYLSTGIDPDTLHLILPFITTLALSALYRKARTPSQQDSLKTHHTPQPQNHIHYNNAQPARQPQAPQNTHNVQDDMHLQIQKHLEAQHQKHIAQPQHSNPQQNTIPQQVPNFAQQAQTRPVQQNQINTPHQQQASRPFNHQQAAPEQRAPQQNQQDYDEPLPNIIVQAQQAYEKKNRKKSGKSRLRGLLGGGDSKPQLQQPSAHQVKRQAPVNNQQVASPTMHHRPSHAAPQQPVHLPQTNALVPQQKNRKYVSLQEKLSNKLPWYEQVG